jgi:nicotinate-nucleotide pyrophosphorylase (carboxylating)
MFLPRRILEERLRRILEEDIGQGDTTTELIIPPETKAEAEVIAKDSGVIAGVEEAKIFLESLGLRVETLVSDGDKITARQTLIKVFGDARTILSAERTLLNLLSRMSAIATATRKLIEKLRTAGLKTKVACTRKTAPGSLYFDKKAVIIGGGDPHRLHLDDMILIKDNHITVVGGIEKAIKKAIQKKPFSKKIEVEVSGIDDVLRAARTDVDIVMLDNFSTKQIRKACTLLKKAKLNGKILLEASGGITADNILEFAATGVDIVSLGEITNSVKALDMSLEIMRISTR